MSAKWKYGFLCDGAMQVHGKWTFQGVFSKFQVVGFPTVSPVFAIGIGFNGPVGPHTLTIRYVDSKGKMLAPEFRLAIECREFMDTEIVLPNNGPIALPAEGFYSFRIILDDQAEPFGEIEFQVVLQRPNPAGGVTDDDR